MGMWTDYYRIVKPKSNKQSYASDQYSLSTFYSNFSVYSKLMKGSASRFQLYAQVNGMDADVDVARSLDTIAEEMTPENTKTNLPFEIDYQNDDNKEVDEHITMTLKAALRHWCKLQNLSAKNFNICRTTIMYGDCFFRKTSDLKPWIYVDPMDIIAVVLDEMGKIQAYHLRKGENKEGGFSEVEVVPAAGMVHFTLYTDTGKTGPFGESILKPALKAWRQLTMLEDAVIIYRIVRAPERRVFFIDTGNMPPQKVKQYLTALMSDVKQKRIPTTEGGTSADKVDSVYNPMSMTEDYFFAQTANGRGSRVETLPGGENLGEITDLNYFQSKFFRGLRIPMSYMSAAKDGGAQRQDGKVGLAYIEELRFANYVRRLQNKLEPTYDQQFKSFLKSTGIKVDENLFTLTLPEPQNFAAYKQATVDTDLISNFNNIKEVKFISPRYALKRYLQWTEDDIQTNEAMLRQERMIPEGGLDIEKLSDIRMFYDPNWLENQPKLDGADDAFKVTLPEQELNPEEPPKEEGAEGEEPPAEDEEGGSPMDALGGEEEEGGEDEPPPEEDKGDEKNPLDGV